MTGARTPSAIVPKEEQAGVDMMSLGGHPADGSDLGAAGGMNDTARAGEAQVARDDQPRGYGAGLRHQQHKQRRRSRPQVAPEQQVAASSTGDSARTGEAQVAQERASQGLGRTQTAALGKQKRSGPLGAGAAAAAAATAAAAAGHPRATRNAHGPGRHGWDRREGGTSSERSGPKGTQDGHQKEGGCISGERGY